MTTLPQKQERDPVLAFFRAKQANLLAAVPRGLEGALTAEYLFQGIGLLLERNPSLRSAHPRTLYAAILSAMRLGLDPTGASGEIALIAYKGSVQMQLMALGKLHLAERYGGIELQSVGVIHENDTVHEMNDADNTLRYTRAPSGSRGKMRYAYVRWFTKTGRVRQHIMDYEDYLVIKEQARVKNGGRESPAYKLYDSQMFERSAISRALKRVDRSPELLALMGAADNVYAKEAGTARRPTVVDESGTVVLEDEFEGSAPQAIQEDAPQMDINSGGEVIEAQATPTPHPQTVAAAKGFGDAITKAAEPVRDPETNEIVPEPEELAAKEAPPKAGKQQKIGGMP